MYIELLKKAKNARELAYAEYSGFMVGAALLCSDGTIFSGCNIENKSFSLTNCAERTAIFKAVSNGFKDFKAIAIVGAKKESDCMIEKCFPCGACLQVMTEFCNSDFEIVLAEKNEAKIYRLSELMPEIFTSQF